MWGPLNHQRTSTKSPKIIAHIKRRVHGYALDITAQQYSIPCKDQILRLLGARSLSDPNLCF